MYQFKIEAGSTVHVDGLPVTLKEDAIIESATDFLGLPRDSVSQYEFLRAPGAEQGLIKMREAK